MAKIIVIEPSKKPEVREYPKLSLKTMQDIVGGMIEVVSFNGKKLLLVVNEEGKLMGLKPSFRYFDDVICGTSFVCRERGADMVGLTDTDIEEVLSKFKTSSHIGR